jgi:hypothetical protein
MVSKRCFEARWKFQANVKDDILWRAVFPASKARSRQKLVSEVQKMDGLPLAGTNVMILKIFSPKN